MDHSNALLLRGWLDPHSPVGIVLLVVLMFVLASAVVLLIRRGTRRIERHLSDTTTLGFASAFAQMLAYLFGFVLYAHLIPELRALGTALLAGVSVISVVIGVAAQSTLGNLVCGIALVTSRALRVGDEIELGTEVGLVSARVKSISLGFTVMVDGKGHDVVVPNSLVMGSTITLLSRTHGP